MVVAHLEAREQRLVGEPFERPRIGPQGVAGMGRKRAAGEHGEARQRQPLRAADLATGRAVAETPVRAGAGIEQHADHGEIEFGPCPRGAIAPGGGAGDARPAVLSVEHEMPPSRMEGNVEIGIGRARDLEGQVGGVLKAVQIDPEMRQPILEALAQQQVRPFAHGGGAQQRQGGGGFSVHAQYFSSGRPTVSAGSCGAGSGE